MSLDPSAQSSSDPVNGKLLKLYSPVETEITYRSMFIRRMRLLRFFRKKFLTECITLDGHNGRVTCMFYHHGLVATGLLFSENLSRIYEYIVLSAVVPPRPSECGEKLELYGDFFVALKYSAFA